MGHYEPGEEFDVQYGNGHTIRVKALGLRSKRKALGYCSQLKDAAKDPEIGYLAIEELLKLIVVDYSDDLLDKLDESMAMDIANQVFAAARLDDETKKKSE